MRALIALAAVLCAIPAFAEEVAVVVDSEKPGSYLVTVGADGSVSVNPLRVIRPGQSPSPPTDPSDPPGNPTAFSGAVAALTKAAIADGASPTTAAGLSAVYSLVSSGVKDGSIPEASALAAVKAATDTVLANVADAPKWAKWRTDLGLALETLKQQGVLKIPSALDEVATGIDTAIGKKINPTKLAGLSEAQQNREAAILDGLDLAKIIELIRLIMDLLKLFKGQ